MKNPNLLTRSAYTFFNSLLKIEDIINASMDNGFSNAFLVDKNIMYGAMEFYKKATNKNIKPIIGLEIDYNDIQEVVIAKNNKGYKELMEISTRIQLGQDIKIDSDNLYILSNKIKPVAYLKKGDKKTLNDFHSAGKGNPLEVETSHFLKREEFEKEYGSDLLNEIDSLIDEVNVEIKEQKNVLPKYKTVDGTEVDSREHLENELKQALVSFLNKDKSLDKDLYVERVKYELDVISKMGFESYFLIVADIVKWSKDNGIFVGPGRGSAAGSIISFLLDITTIDPIKNNLLFERFLNPERISMPDIDLDFEDTRRDEVIEYIADRWGRANVAQIITYQTLRARMAFKDIARLKEISATEQNNITKLIPEDQTLEQAYNSSKTFNAKINSSELLKEVYESAKLIEGLPRQFSTHAAGVVLSDKPIYKSVPAQKGYGTILQTQYSMDYMEYNGLLKIDILGLRNLSFINETLANIKENRGEEVKLNRINFDDPKVYSLLASGKTSGVFQLESPGMKSSLRDIKVTNFEDVVATTSLFRPGPMKMIPDFAARKNGKQEYTYINDEIKEILEPTYGIIVYQEQIMKMVQVMSNFTLAKADILRRAIGKKDIELLESLKEDFYNGAKENGHSEDIIKQTYDLIYEFSNYGFNRSHAFAYTTISYWLAWLKINYPLEFMNSLLNSVIGNVTKTPSYISETQDLGIKIIEPNIVKSKGDFTIVDKDIYIGLRTIKGVGESAIKSIEVIQQNLNDKTSFIDFMILCSSNGINQSIIELLTKAGALSVFGYNKETILTNLEKVYNYLDMIKKKEGEGFVFDKSILPEPKIDIVEKSEDTKYFNEVMGFSLLGEEDLAEFKELEKKFKIKSDDINTLSQDQKVTFIGEVISVRPITTKTGKAMAFGKITNGHKKIDAVLWPAVYEKFSNQWKASTKAIFYATVDLKRGEQLVINKMEVIE